MGGSRVIRVTNIAPQATRDQMQTLFTFVGKVEEIKLYPTVRDVAIPVASRVSFVKFINGDHVGIAQHLNNTVFIDRALIIVPYESPDIPDEHAAMQALVQSNGALGVTNEQQLPAHVSNVVDGAFYITRDPTFAEHGVPEYPSLPCTLEYGQVEEIRRTVVIGNLAPTVDAQQVIEWLVDAGEVKYARMCGRETDESRACLIEFTEQASIIPAMKKSGQLMGDRALVVAHASLGIAKPQIKSNEMAQREIEEAMRRAQEQQSLTMSTMKPDMVAYMDDAKRSRSRERGGGGRRRRSRSRDRRRRSRSRSPRHSRSRYSPIRDRRRSRSRDRKSRSRRSRSRSRDRGRRSRHRSRSRSRDRRRDDRDRRGSSRDRDRRDKDRSRDKDRRDKDRSKSSPDKSSAKDSRDKSRSPSKEKSSKARSRSHSPAKKRSRSRSVDRRRGGRSSRASPSRRRSRSRSRDRRHRRSSRSPGRRRSRSPGRKRSRSPRGSHSRSLRSPDAKRRDRDRSRDRDKDRKRDKDRREKDSKSDKSDAKVSRDYDEEEKGYDEDTKKSVSRESTPADGKGKKSAGDDDMDISD